MNFLSMFLHPDSLDDVGDPCSIIDVKLLNQPQRCVKPHPRRLHGFPEPKRGTLIQALQIITELFDAWIVAGKLLNPANDVVDNVVVEQPVVGPARIKDAL